MYIKVLFAILAMIISLEANVKVYHGMAQLSTKEMAIQEATWKGFENALMEILGEDMQGSVINSFRKDMEIDFEEFKRKYTDFSSHQCQDLKDEGFYCEVQSNINFRKLRSFVKRKSKHSSTMGKNTLQSLDIALINNVATQDSESFINALISAVNKSGNNLYVLEKGSQVGKKGNHCKEIQRVYERVKKKGVSYQKAIDSAKRKLEQCEENKNVEYAFSLDVLTFNEIGKTDLDEIEGDLTCEISMFNAQTGKRNKSIDPMVVHDVDSTVAKLKVYLYKQMAIKVSEQFTENMLDYISTKNDTKKVKKLEKFDYVYTIILMGLTNDSEGRGIKRVFKDGVKKMGYKIKKVSAESSDFKQVYNFGTNEEIDVEDLTDSLYDISDSIGIPVQITDDGNNILNVQFQ
jgi:hypothetical protein